ncbi:VapC toxin family PIN domain ribonuclease [Streptomyces rubiginosohelvolus]|uniref:VapC toxin family PIN domain ribonuclease n=1 Tax=Streptomyces rubiginosohelvolus TaxID=67362 RepID=UPI00365F865F
MIHQLDTSGLVRLLSEPARQAARFDAIEAGAVAFCYPQRAESQHRMARAGQHRSASAVDLIIAATAAHHGLTVLHDDLDYRTVARHAPDLGEHSVHDVA